MDRSISLAQRYVANTPHEALADSATARKRATAGSSNMSTPASLDPSRAAAEYDLEQQVDEPLQYRMVDTRVTETWHSR
jgi:hypothetical protein